MFEKDDEECEFNVEEMEIDAQDCCSDSSNPKNSCKQKMNELVQVSVEKPYINLNDYLKRNPLTPSTANIDLPFIPNTPPDINFFKNDPKSAYLLSAEKMV